MQKRYAINDITYVVNVLVFANKRLNRVMCRLDFDADMCDK